MRNVNLLAGLVAATLFTACGGTDPGVGSNTMYVHASLDSDGSSDGTSIVVEVRENDRTGPAITDALVTLKGQSGSEQMIGLISGGRGIPVYAHTGFAWDMGFVLSIRRGGTDSLDAALEMPGITVITDPVSSTTFNRAQGTPLVVRWRDQYGRAAEYPEVRFDTADIRQTLAQDAQQFSIDSMRLVPTTEEHVTVTRTNKVLLQGGLDGSEWSATTHHRIAFRVE